MAVKNKKTILAVAAGLAVFFLIFAWLFWGSTVPEPTDKTKKQKRIQRKRLCIIPYCIGMKAENVFGS